MPEAANASVKGIVPTPASSPVVPPSPSVDLRDAIVGTWKPDPESLKVDFGEKGKDPDFQQQLPATIADLKKKLVGSFVTFGADASYISADSEGHKETGTYKLDGLKVALTPVTTPPTTYSISADGTTVALHIADQDLQIDLVLKKS